MMSLAMSWDILKGENKCAFEACSPWRETFVEVRALSDDSFERTSLNVSTDKIL